MVPHGTDPCQPEETEAAASAAVEADRRDLLLQYDPDQQVIAGCEPEPQVPLPGVTRERDAATEHRLALEAQYEEEAEAHVAEALADGKAEDQTYLRGVWFTRSAPWRRKGVQGGRPDLDNYELDGAFSGLCRFRRNGDWSDSDWGTWYEVQARCMTVEDAIEYLLAEPAWFSIVCVPAYLRRFLLLIVAVFCARAFGLLASNAELAAYLGVSERTVQNQRRRLVELGYLKKSDDPGRKDGEFAVDRTFRGDKPKRRRQDKNLYRLGPKVESLAKAEAEGTRHEDLRRDWEKQSERAAHLAAARRSQQRAEASRNQRRLEERRARSRGSLERRLRARRLFASELRTMPELARPVVLSKKRRESSSSPSLIWDEMSSSLSSSSPPGTGGRGEELGFNSPSPAQFDDLDLDAIEAELEGTPLRTPAESAASLDKNSEARAIESPPPISAEPRGSVALESEGFSGPNKPNLAYRSNSARSDAWSELNRGLQNLPSHLGESLRRAVLGESEPPGIVESPKNPAPPEVEEALDEVVSVRPSEPEPPAVPARPAPKPKSELGPFEGLAADAIRKAAEQLGFSTTLEEFD